MRRLTLGTPTEAPRRLWVAALVAAAIGGCQRGPAPPKIETKTGALTGAQTFVIRLP